MTRVTTLSEFHYNRVFIDATMLPSEALLNSGADRGRSEFPSEDQEFQHLG